MNGCLGHGTAQVEKGKVQVRCSSVKTGSSQVGSDRAPSFIKFSHVREAARIIEGTPLHLVEINLLYALPRILLLRNLIAMKTQSISRPGLQRPEHRQQQVAYLYHGDGLSSCRISFRRLWNRRHRVETESNRTRGVLGRFQAKLRSWETKKQFLLEKPLDCAMVPVLQGSTEKDKEKGGKREKVKKRLGSRSISKVRPGSMGLDLPMDHLGNMVITVQTSFETTSPYLRQPVNCHFIWNYHRSIYKIGSLREHLGLRLL